MSCLVILDEEGIEIARFSSGDVVFGRATMEIKKPGIYHVVQIFEPEIPESFFDISED